jgi:RNA polymerase sigma factor (sigma-70 family)
VKGSDQDLIKALLSGNPSHADKGWEFIYQQYYPIVRDLITKSNGSVNDAIDIFQDGLIILNRNLANGTFRSESTIKTYIYSICKNLWLKELNKKKQRAVLEVDYPLYSGDDDAFLLNVKMLSTLMDELKDDCRSLLTDFYYNNKSMAELMVMFNVTSIQAIKNKKYRCLGYLVKLFKNRSITSPELNANE